MRIFRLICPLVATAAFCSPAFAADPSKDQNQNLSPVETQMESLWSKLTDAERAEFVKRHTQNVTPPKTKTASAKIVKAAAPPAPPAPTQSGDNGQSPSTSVTDFLNNIFGKCPGLGITLRKSWTDIDLGSCPQAAKSATGALLSYSDDQVKHDETWSAIGTAALIYSPQQTVGSPYVFSTGVYTSLNKVTNSAAAQSSSNADQVGYGGFLQGGVVNTTLDTYSANYLRLRGGQVDDDIKHTTNANIIAEWIPVYDDGTIKIHSGIPIPGTAALFRIDPEIEAQYVEVTGKKQSSAFNGRTQALPVGPQVTLRFYPGTSDFWSHFVPTFTYWWAYEPYSRQSISWLDASLAYNLDQDGHLAISISYEKGNNVDTAGTFTNMYLLSLTGKI